MSESHYITFHSYNNFNYSLNAWGHFNSKDNPHVFPISLVSNGGKRLLFGAYLCWSVVSWWYSNSCLSLDVGWLKGRVVSVCVSTTLFSFHLVWDYTTAMKWCAAWTSVCWRIEWGGEEEGLDIFVRSGSGHSLLTKETTCCFQTPPVGNGDELKSKEEYIM